MNSLRLKVAEHAGRFNEAKVYPSKRYKLDAKEGNCARLVLKPHRVELLIPEPAMQKFRFTLLLASSLFLVFEAKAQFQAKNPTILVVQVCIGSYQNPAPPNLSVQLQDELGSLEQEGHTDTRGIVEFNTFTTTKQVRIFGPGISEHQETIEIAPVESRKMVNIIVKEDQRGLGKTVSLGGAVPVERLNVPEKAQKEFQKGSESLRKKDWIEAKKRFTAAIALYERYDVAYNGLGMALASSGSNSEARVAFEKAISLNENFSEAYRNLARISLSEKNYAAAEQLLARSLASDPLNAWALAYSAYADLQLKKFDEALAHAHKAHEVGDKGLSSAHIVAALALEATEQLSGAVREYQLYLEEDPNGRDAGRAKDRLAALTANTDK